jgi:hydrogenase maturation protease
VVATFRRTRISRTPDADRTLVIGAGNPIAGDDGIGIAALERLLGQWRFDDAVELVDGGTWGMNLLPLIEDTHRLLVLDAVRAGKPPGALVTVQREELPRTLALKLSPHQIDLREVFALAELRGTLPEQLVVLGIQPLRIEDMHVGLSPVVAASLDALVESAIVQLRAWGHEPTPLEAARA